MKTSVSTSRISKANLFETVYSLNKKGGPEVYEYNHIDNCMDAITSMMKQGIITNEEIEMIKNNCEFLKSDRSVMGHIKLKPFGYAGDYLIIDRIYRKDVSTKYTKWDNYSMHNIAAAAVRNRKEFFKALIHEKLKTHKTLRLLSIASGPARDLKEIFDEIDPKCLTVTCVEMDKRAIEHATNVCGKYMDRITFINQNVFKFRTEEKFDLVWSAGLFDYFTDKLFVKLVKTFQTFLAQNGEILIGNFSKENPGRVYMEVFGEWFLNHRSPAELTQLAIDGGIDKNNIMVDKECLGVNLFLRMRNEGSTNSIAGDALNTILKEFALSQN